jgi:cation diffusion facilitator CzcD-associated flavoprotein CzcO
VDESLHNTKVVDLLIIGGGPATLGFIMNALKTNRFPELIQNDGMAILDAGTSFGGGNLCNYGINSNTSANGFVKSILRKDKKENAFPDKLKAATHKVAALKPQSKFAAMKPKPKPRNLGTDKKAILVVDVD